MISVVIIEDEKVIRESMSELLSIAGDVKCIGSYTKSEEFMKDFSKIKPDVVLVDINLPGKSGIDCVAEMKPLNPSIQYIICTSFDHPDNIFDSLKLGASGYILKNSSPIKIIEAIKDVYNGGSPMSPQIARMVVNSFSERHKNASLINSFNAREQEILHALAKGYQYREIAEKLKISVETVRTYLRRIYDKLQVHSKVEALNKVFPK